MYFETKDVSHETAPPRIAFLPPPGKVVPGTHIRTRWVRDLLNPGLFAAEIRTPDGKVSTMSLVDLDRAARTDPAMEAIRLALGA